MEEKLFEREILSLKKEIKLLKSLVAGLVALVLIVEIFGIPFLPSRRVDSDHEAGIDYEKLESAVIPKSGYKIPVKWNDFGKKMVEAGVIDGQKFESLYAGKGGLSEGEKRLIYGSENKEILIDLNNSGIILNLFWAFGLANKSEILDLGPMVSEQFGGDPARFASTGGWTLSSGNAMNHYSKHEFVSLSEEQKNIVKDVSSKIYRPCCNNPTLFPDCNHGMAMLGLLQILASQGFSEKEMLEVALKVNSYWFPDQYLTIARYLDSQGKSWNDVSAEELLGPNYSSASGFGKVKNAINPNGSSSGSSCSV